VKGSGPSGLLGIPSSAMAGTGAIANHMTINVLHMVCEIMLRQDAYFYVEIFTYFILLGQYTVSQGQPENGQT
jgi:hypothetical protein